MRLKYLVGLVLFSLFLPLQNVLAETPALNIKPFFATPTVVGSLASGDMDDDGANEVVVGAPKGSKPYVRIFSSAGTLEREFSAYSETFTGGVNVAVCDLVPGGELEIVTGAGNTGSPHVRAFTLGGTPLATDFTAYDVSFKGGVNVACGDIDADGLADIVTGPGITGGPHVKVFSADGAKKFEVFTGSASEPVGAYVSVGDVNGIKGDEIVTTQVASGVKIVTTLTYKNNGLGFISSFPVNSKAAVSSPITLANVSADAGQEIIISVKSGADSTVSAYTEGGVLAGTQTLSLISVGVLTTNGTDLVYANTPAEGDILTAPKFILVDISEQTLRLYEYGVEVKSFLVSTGKPGYRTPTGKTTIMKKIPIMTYAWNYGPDDPRNYNLPNVKWNMRVFPHIYIHSAYWHNKFGRPVSHGCINMSTTNAGIVYEWADEGTAVEVRQ